MYQSLMLGALVGMSLTPRAVAGATTDSGPTKGNAGSVVQASPSRAAAAAAASVASVASSDADVMRVIRKASIEKAIDLTFWW